MSMWAAAWLLTYFFLAYSVVCLNTMFPFVLKFEKSFNSAKKKWAKNKDMITKIWGSGTVYITINTESGSLVSNFSFTQWKPDVHAAVIQNQRFHFITIISVHTAGLMSHSVCIACDFDKGWISLFLGSIYILPQHGNLTL